MKYLNRYVWVYLNFDYKSQTAELTMFVSPDQYAPHLNTIATPFKYRLTRDDVRYNVSSEVELSQSKAVEIASLMFESEFVIAPNWIAKKRG